jgi:hypothetical protein
VDLYDGRRGESIETSRMSIDWVWVVWAFGSGNCLEWLVVEDEEWHENARWVGI